MPKFRITYFEGYTNNPRKEVTEINASSILGAKQTSLKTLSYPR